MRVYAGRDPVSKRNLYPSEIVPAGPRADREAETVRIRLLNQVDEFAKPSEPGDVWGTSSTDGSSRTMVIRIRSVPTSRRPANTFTHSSGTYFRDDLPKIDVPTLLIHGDADRILPYDATAGRLPGLIKDLTAVTVAGGPANIGRTHADEVNAALVDFLAK